MEKGRFSFNIFEKVSAGLMLFLVVLSFTMANLHAILWIGSEFMVSAILPAVIVDLTNDERDGGSLGTLHRNETLDRAAQMKAEDMARHGYFAHYSPDGVSPWHWFNQVSYNYVHAGENLAVHFTDSENVVEAWMESPTHRANIMNGNYTEIGVGTARGEYKGVPTVFVVQLFGTPNAETREIPPVPDIVAMSEPEPEAVTLGVQDTQTPIETASIENAPPEIVETPPVEERAESSETSFMSTSRQGTPAPVAVSQPQSTALERVGTQPDSWLQILYILIASIVLISLIISSIIEWRRHHAAHVAFAGVLMGIMALLYQIYTVLTGGVTIV